MADPHVALLDDWAALDALGPEWDALADTVPGCSYYQTATATLALAIRNDPALRPAVLTARDATGALCGVLPLAIRTRDARRTLVPLVEWHASVFDTIAGSPSIAQALWRGSTQLISGWDVADLRYVPDHALLRQAIPAGWSADGVAKRLPLDRGAWAATPPKFAVEMRRLSRRGELVFAPTTPRSSLPELIERFAALHTARWHSEGPAAEFADEAGRARLTALLVPATDQGVARIGTLQLDDEIIAVHIAFWWHRVHYTWRIAHAPGWKPYSIGMMLYDLMFRAAADEGAVAAELGRGDEPYKERWHPVSSPLWRRLSHGPTLRGRLGRAKTQLRRLLPGAPPHHPAA
jgi:CelD/BcsL family acetyltransferase involved in cellulose biosynthesis